jgi:hypothetical protein
VAEEVWTEDDINNMSMEEYAKYRQWIMEQIRYMTPEQARECMEILKPPPPFRFRHF